MYVKEKAVSALVYFPLILDSDAVTFQTGKAGSMTVEVSKDGGAFAAATNSPSELGTTGIYHITLTATEMDADSITVRATDTGVLDQMVVISTYVIGSIADAVWDEAKSGHVAAGSFGEEVQSHATPTEVKTEADQALVDYDPPTKAELDTTESNIRGADSDDLKVISDQIDTLPSASGIADQVWDEAKAGHVGAGTFGEEVQSHATPTEVKAEADQALVDYDPPTKAELDTAESNIRGTDGDDLKDISDQIDALPTAGGIADQVWDEAKAGHVAVGSFGEEVQSHATPTEVKAEADQALIDYDPPTKAELDTAESNIRGADSDDLKTISDQIDTLPSASSIADQVWDEPKAGHVAAGSFGEEVQSHATPTEVKTEADQALTDYDPPTKAELDTAESNIRGADSDDLQDLSQQLDALQADSTAILGDTNEMQGKLPTNNIMGSSVKTDKDDEIDLLVTRVGVPAVTIADDIASVQDSVDDISNVTRFSATIPILERPSSGSFTYRIRVNLEDTDGNPEDPDGNTITVNVENQAGVSRNGNLDSTTMTRIAAGRYEVLYTVSSAHLLEQLIFEFSYAENTVAFTKDKTSTVVDASEVGYTSTDRTRDNQIAIETAAILVDTAEMQGKLPTNNIMGSSVKSDKDDEIDAIKGQTDQLSFSGSNVQARVADKGVLNDLSAAQVKAEADQALVDYDPPTKAELDTAENNIRGADGDDLKDISDQIDLLPTAGVIVDQVWDEAKAGHVGAGSFGEEVQSHATPTEVKAEADQALSDYDPPTMAELDAVENNIRGADGDTLKTLSDQIDGIPSGIGGAVWDEPKAGHVAAGSFGEEVQSHATPTEVKSEADQALIDYDPPTKAELDLVESSIRGSDGDDLKTLSDQIDGLPTAAQIDSQLTANHGSGSWKGEQAAGAIADQVWDEAKAAHSNPGSFGEEVQSHATPTEVKTKAGEALTDYGAAKSGDVSTAESNIRGSDSDDLKTLSDQIDGVAASASAIDSRLPTNPADEGSQQASHTATQNAVAAVQTDVTSIKATIENRVAVKQNFSYNPTTSTFIANVWVERLNAVQTGPSDLTFTLYDEDGTQVFQEVVSSPDANGFFKVTKASPGIEKNKAYYAISRLTLDSTVSSGKGAFTVG